MCDNAIISSKTSLTEPTSRAVIFRSKITKHSRDVNLGIILAPRSRWSVCWQEGMHGSHCNGRAVQPICSIVRRKGASVVNVVLLVVVYGRCPSATMCTPGTDHRLEAFM
jgi:hypothetical protein